MLKQCRCYSLVNCQRQPALKHRTQATTQLVNTERTRSQFSAVRQTGLMIYVRIGIEEVILFLFF